MIEGFGIMVGGGDLRAHLEGRRHYHDGIATERAEEIARRVLRREAASAKEKRRGWFARHFVLWLDTGDPQPWEESRMRMDMESESRAAAMFDFLARKVNVNETYRLSLSELRWLEVILI